MFKMVENPEFTHDVPVMVPIDNGHREEKFRARFRAIPEALANELLDDEVVKADAGKAFLRQIVVEIMDVVDEADAKVPFSPDMLEAMIAIPYVRAALSGAYFRSFTKARAGN